MAYSFLYFENTFVDLVTVTFTTLIVAELLNVVSELHKLRVVMLLAQCFTLLLYMASLVFLRSYFNLSDIN